MPTESNVIVVDDEKPVLELQRDVLDQAGISAETYSDPLEAWERIQRGGVNLVITDWMMPQMTGMDLLFKTRGLEQPPPVLLLTAHSTVDRAVQAMTSGAFSFLGKPFSNQEYVEVVTRALQRQLSAGASRLELADAADSKSPSQEALVCSPAMRQAFEIARVAAKSDCSILLLGESGTGKEVLADFIHRHSARARGPMLKVNCGALPEHLMESELFGHEKGAFTGADRRRVGRFEEASGGTLFLDEVGDMLLPLQVKLLRALQSRVIERVGSSAPIPVDFRLICATHRNIRAAIDSGAFRGDLFYRINVIPIHLPPLRERVEDIRPLAEYFLKRIHSRMTRGPAGISPEALRLLERFDWPGNVRQLGNAMEYASVMCTDKLVQPASLPAEIRQPLPEAVSATAARMGQPAEAAAAAGLRDALDSDAPDLGEGLEACVGNFEANLIRSTLERLHWNVSEAARVLKISRSGMYERIARYNIKR